MEIAKDINLPLFLHCRGPNAFEDLFHIMKDCLGEKKFSNAVVHSFSSDKKDLDLALENGCYIGLNGM